MKGEHRIIREMLKQLPLPEAKEILQNNLPSREFTSIYWSDIEQYDLNFVADSKMHISESNVKKIRQSGYKKLAAIYFPKK